MPEVRRRRVRPVEDDYEDEEDELEEEDEDEEPVERPRDRVRKAKAAQDDDVDFTDFDEDEEDDEPAPRSRTRRAAPKPARSRTRRAPVDEEEEEEEEEAPRRRRSTATTAPKRRRPVEDDDDEEAPRSRRRPSSTNGKGKLHPGLRPGLQGAEETLRSGGSGANRVVLTSEAQLIKILENEPFISFLQHWIRADGGNRPYTCWGRGCPLCEMGNNPTKVIAFNVLSFSAGAEPQNKILQIGAKPYQALKELATDKTTNTPLFGRNYWSVSKSGKGQRSQVNFLPVKVRDIADDWEEVLETFEIEDLPEVVKKARRKMFDPSAIQVQTMKQLRDVAKYLTEDEDEDED
jgi:hypothetical protein